MSAFVVSRKTIAAIVWELTDRLDVDEFNRMAKVLYDANVKSYLSLYSHKIKAEDMHEFQPFTASELLQLGKSPPAVAFKSCICFSYQACEPDDYVGSPADDLIRMASEAAARRGFGEAYEQAPWGL